MRILEKDDIMKSLTQIESELEVIIEALHNPNIYQ